MKQFTKNRITVLKVKRIANPNKMKDRTYSRDLQQEESKRANYGQS